MATWPASLPQLPLRDGYNEQGDGNTIRTPMDVGPPKRRRRYTAEVVKFSIVLELTAAQLSTLETFYLTTLTDGVDAFDWVDFRSGASASYAFVTRPPYTPIGGELWRTQFTLEKLP